MRIANSPTPRLRPAPIASLDGRRVSRRQMLYTQGMMTNRITARNPANIIVLDTRDNMKLLIAISMAKVMFCQMNGSRLLARTA